jgi:hypothetical protein
MKNTMLVILYRPSKKMCTHNSPTGGVRLKRAQWQGGVSPTCHLLERLI